MLRHRPLIAALKGILLDCRDPVNQVERLLAGNHRTHKHRGIHRNIDRPVPVNGAERIILPFPASLRQSLRPVSYTHLDVYKRQAEDGAVSLEITRSPLMRLTNARRVRVSTAGVRRRADVTLFLAKQQLDALLPMHSLSDFDGRVRLWPLLVMAASSSNAALGLLTLSLIHICSACTPIEPVEPRITSRFLSADAVTALTSFPPALTVLFPVYPFRRYKNDANLRLSADQRQIMHQDKHHRRHKENAVKAVHHLSLIHISRTACLTWW